MPAGLLLGLGNDRCSKFHNSSFRTQNLEVEDFLERWFNYLQVLFRSRSGLKAARGLKRAKHKTVQIWVKTASTTSSRFERVSCVRIEPNELHAYIKNRGTLNKLTLGILEKFARVSFRFSMVGNFTTHPKHFYIDNNHIPDFHHPSSTIIQVNISASMLDNLIPTQPSPRPTITSPSKIEMILSTYIQQRMEMASRTMMLNI